MNQKNYSLFVILDMVVMVWFFFGSSLPFHVVLWKTQSSKSTLPCPTISLVYCVPTQKGQQEELTEYLNWRQIQSFKFTCSEESHISTYVRTSKQVFNSNCAIIMYMTLWFWSVACHMHVKSER